MDKTEVGFGDLVRDRHSGVEGIVTVIVDWCWGCRRVSVQPEGLNDDKKPYEHAIVDSVQLDVVKAAKPKVNMPETKYGQLDFVECKITHMKGTVEGIAYYPNGVVRYVVKPKGVNPKTKLDYPSDTVDETDIILIKSAAAPKPKPKYGPRPDVASRGQITF